MAEVFARWHPVTQDFGLIRAPIDDVVGEYLEWHQSIKLEYSRTNITSSFVDALQTLLPLAPSKWRKLFVPTRSDWVAFFQNGIQGSDPSPPMTVLAERMKVPSMRVCSTPLEAKYPATIWEMYDERGIRRTVSAANDGGRWKFGESGERYSFEQPESYSKAKKRDRFTRRMLCNYLRRFDIELFSDDFFKVSAASPAVNLQRRGSEPSERKFSLEDVISGRPWAKSSDGFIQD